LTTTAAAASGDSGGDSKHHSQYHHHRHHREEERDEEEREAAGAVAVAVARNLLMQSQKRVGRVNECSIARRPRRGFSVSVLLQSPQTTFEKRKQPVHVNSEDSTTKIEQCFRLRATPCRRLVQAWEAQGS
jgi:hypothetical protein